MPRYLRFDNLNYLDAQPFIGHQGWFYSIEKSMEDFMMSHLPIDEGNILHPTLTAIMDDGTFRGNGMSPVCLVVFFTNPEYKSASES